MWAQDLSVSLTSPFLYPLLGQLFLKLQDPALRGGRANADKEEQELTPHPTPAVYVVWGRGAKQAGQKLWVSPRMGDGMDVMNELSSHRGKGEGRTDLKTAGREPVSHRPWKYHHLPTLASAFRCIPDRRRCDIQIHFPTQGSGHPQLAPSLNTTITRRGMAGLRTQPE